MVRMVQTHEEFVELIGSGAAVAVDFTASWCGPCKMIGPKFEALADEIKDVTFVKVDVDANKQTAAMCGIQSMPTFKFYRDNVLVNSFSGADENGLRHAVSQLRKLGYDVIPVGTAIRIGGLVKAAHLNGMTATVCGFDRSKGRFNVEVVEDNGTCKRIALRPSGVAIQCVPVKIKTGGAGNTVVQSWNADKESPHYLLRSEGGAEVSVGVEDVELLPGMVVQVWGLKGAPQHNGKWGKILSLDADAGRYVVQVGPDDHLKLKPKNLLLGHVEEPPSQCAKHCCHGPASSPCQS